ncbi:MAG: zinc-ribbon domain-containing protein [Clostridium sp.]|nr:zinc-ribbon domain-containing protein [Clostridium sp.]
MAFFDDLGKALSDTGRVVVGKTKDITGALQLKAKVNAEKDKINKAYIELGKAYYEQLKGTDNPRYAAEVRAISEGLLQVEELENQIMELEGTRICAECGAKVMRGAKFCSKCGAPLPEMPPKQEDDLAAEWADAARNTQAKMDSKVDEVSRTVGEAADNVVKAATEMAAGAAAAAEAMGEEIGAAAEKAVHGAAEAADSAAATAEAVANKPEEACCGGGKTEEACCGGEVKEEKEEKED